MLVPTEFINQCKDLGVDKNTAVTYFTNKTNKKPTTSVLTPLVPTIFKTIAEANSKMLQVFKTYNAKSNQTPKIEPQTKIKDTDYLEQARAALESSLGKFKEPKATNKKGSSKKIVIASDFHVPFHSEKALKELLNQDAETLIIAGDFADMFSSSRHVKDTSWISMKEELASLRAVAELISASFKDVYWIEGNHDANPNKRLLENLPHLGIAASFNLLELVTMGIKNFKPLSWEVKGTKAHTKFAEDELLRQFAMFGDVAICHFDHFTGAEAAIKANTFLDTWSHILKLPTEPKVILHGHTHRLNLSYTPQGKVLISSGCMAQAQGYQLQQAGKYQPPTVGFITLEQTNGVTDINSIKTVFIG